MDLHLVDRSRPHALPGDIDAAAERCARPFAAATARSRGSRNPVGDRVERRAAMHLQVRGGRGTDCEQVFARVD